MSPDRFSFFFFFFFFVQACLDLCAPHPIFFFFFFFCVTESYIECRRDRIRNNSKYDALKTDVFLYIYCITYYMYLIYFIMQCIIFFLVVQECVSRRCLGQNSVINISYSQSFVYCRVFVLLLIDYSTKKGVLVYSRKCASEIVYFRSNPYIKQCELMC